MRPARAPAQLDEAAHGPLTIKLLGPAQLPDLASGAPAGLHQVRVRGRVVPVYPEDPAAPSSLNSPTSLLCTLASGRLDHGGGCELAVRNYTSKPST